MYELILVFARLWNKFVAFSYTLISDNINFSRHTFFKCANFVYANKRVLVVFVVVFVPVARYCLDHRLLLLLLLLCEFKKKSSKWSEFFFRSKWFKHNLNHIVKCVISYCSQMPIHLVKQQLLFFSLMLLLLLFHSTYAFACRLALHRFHLNWNSHLDCCLCASHVSKCRKQNI